MSDPLPTKESLSPIPGVGSEVMPKTDDWSASPGLNESGLPQSSPDEEELLKSLDTLVQQASQGTGEFSSTLATLGENQSVNEGAALPESEIRGEAGMAPSAENAALAFDPNIVGTPEDWTALESVGALDGDAVEALAQWLQVAKPEEREVYSRRIRLGHALLYALEQEPPPSGLRSVLAQDLGKIETSLRKLYPKKSTSISQHLAQALGWPLSRLLKVGLVLITLIAAGGWIMAGRGFIQSRRAETAVKRIEVKLKESEAARQLSDSRLDFAASADLRIADLQSGTHSGHSAAHLLWSPYGRRGLLWVRDFPKAPDGKEYVLWVLSGSRQFAAARFLEAPTGAGKFIDVPALEDGRPRPIEAFTLVLQPLHALDPADGEKLLSASAYF